MQGEKKRITDALERHSRLVRPLPGLKDRRALETLALQFVASIRRENYYKAIQLRHLSPLRADPHNDLFDPERAVAHCVRIGDLEEAAWLVFLMVYFGKAKISGWQRLRDVYGGLGYRVWDWRAVHEDAAPFVSWLEVNWREIGGAFGNHRKYESLRPDASRALKLVVISYLEWLGEGSHRELFAGAVRGAGNDPFDIFDALYQGMHVRSFGRLAKFDYLSMLGRYGIAPVRPGSAYLEGATGPCRGAKLLFDGSLESPTPTGELQMMLNAVDIDLDVGMMVIEDALCNWQKSPFCFVHFKG